MRPDYKNWMPKGMIYSFLGGTIGCGIVAIILALLLKGTLKTALVIAFAAAAVIFCGLTLWAVLMHRAFSYDGKRQMSRQIIEGTAAHVKLPAGGKCLDVGFATAVGKAGADFKRQFTVESYRQFFLDAGYRDVSIRLAEGRIPCAVAVMRKSDDQP